LDADINNLYILNPKNLRSSAAKNGIFCTMNLVRFAPPPAPRCAVLRAGTIAMPLKSIFYHYMHEAKTQAS